MATHHKFFLDLVHVPVRAVSPFLGNDEGTLKQKDPSLFKQWFGPFLEGKNILWEQGVTFTVVSRNMPPPTPYNALNAHYTT